MNICHLVAPYGMPEHEAIQRAKHSFNIYLNFK